MKKSLLAVSGLMMSASLAFAAPQFTGGASFEVSKSNNGTKITKIQTEFFEDAHDTKRLYKVISRLSYQTNMEGQDAQTIVEAYRSKKSLFDTKIWTKKFTGSGFELFSSELVQVTQGGCCGSSDINRLISVDTGAIVEAAFDSTTVTISVPNSKLSLRYMAVAMDSSAPAKKGDKKYIGTVSYFSAGKIKSRARVYATLPDGHGTQISDLKVLPADAQKDQVSDKKLDLFSKDGSGDAATAFSGFAVSGKVYLVEGGEQAFRTPVTADRIDASLIKHTDMLEVDVVQY